MGPPLGARYKSCFVPGCSSDTKRTPGKHFFCVPLEQATRIRWFEVVRPDESFFARQLYYCCQDHFDLKEDLKYTYKGVPVRLKKDVVPHVFNNFSAAPAAAVVKEEEQAPAVVVVPESDNRPTPPAPPKKTWLRNSNKENVAAVAVAVAEPSAKLRKIESEPEVLNDQNNTDSVYIVEQKDVNPQSQPKYFIQNEIVEPETELEYNIQQNVAGSQMESVYIIDPSSIQSQSGAVVYEVAHEDDEIQIIDPPAKEEIVSNFVIKDNNVQNEIQNYLNEQSVLPQLSDLPKLTLISNLSSEPEGSGLHKPMKKIYASEMSGKAEADDSSTISQPSYELQIQGNNIKLKTKTKCTMVKPVMVDVACQCDSAILEDKACSPIKIIIKSPQSNTKTSKSNQTLILMKNINNELFPVLDTDSSEESDKKMEEKAFQALSHFINNNPKEYIGIDGDKLQIIEELQNNTGCSINDIKLTLMKIKMNDSFGVLGREFNISTIQALTIFNKTVGLLAYYLKKYIYVPSAKEIKQNIPIVFRERYSEVCAMIEAIEVDIEKPLDPLKLSWPSTESKKFCTLKYLIACTPDGFVSFVSSGYGGNISDTSLFRESKIVNVLPENSPVMVDGDFDKDIEMVLSKRKCRPIFLNPSSDNLDESSAEKDLKLMHDMSLRFHVERTMKKIQAYRILAPDAGLDLSFMKHVDSIVTIVTGLVNYHRID